MPQAAKCRYEPLYKLSDSMKTVAFVPIRLNSQRVAGKNLRPLDGSPLMCHILKTLTEVEGIDEDYYQRVRRASFGSNLRGLNSFENIAVTLTEGYFHGYDPFRFPQVFDSITKEDVAAFLRRNLTAERAVLSEIVPREN